MNTSISWKFNERNNQKIKILFIFLKKDLCEVQVEQ